MKRGWLKRLLRLLTVMLFLAFGIGLFAYFNLRDVVVWYANRGNPRLELDVRRTSLRWNGIELSDVVLKLRENNEEVVRIPSARIGFSWSDLGQHRIGTVTLNKPHLRITDRLLGSPGNASDVQATTQPETQPWQIRKFAVIDGTGEIDLAAAPVIRFSFAPEFHDLQLSSETRQATAPQTIAVEKIEFLSRGVNPQQIGSINRIELKFSQEGAGKMNFDEIVVRAPSFQITPDAAATLGRVSSSNEPASFPNLRIGKLFVENGEVFLRKFGETVPEGSLKFGMETTDLQLGESGTAVEKRHALQLWDVRLAPSFAPLSPFAYIDSLQLEFTTAGLLQRKEITGATLTGMTVTMGQTFRSYMNTGSGTTATATPSPTPPTAAPVAATVQERLQQWKLRELKIVNSHVIFADLGVGSPTVGFNIATTLKDIPLSAAVSDTAEDIQQQEIADFTITSPLDQFAPVFTMKTLFIRYSIAGLLRREIEEIQVLNPTIYVGEDLFWYFDELSKREEQTEAAVVGPTPPPEETGWKLKKINVAYGQLVIASDGKARLPLPLQFTTSAENLNLGKLSDLKLALDLKVPREDYLFPGYKLELRQLAGNIRFDLPPQTRQNNLVQTLRMSEVRWRQFRAQEGWLSITFDSKGINGQIGAKGYGGYLDGGFTSFFGTNSPWVGWLSGTKVDLKKITDVLAPGNFTMDGPADFKLEANGASSHLERLRGSVQAKRRGQMRIGKLDQILADIPGDWYWVKRELTRIVLETLRDFTYESGDASFWFLNDEGNLKLTLQGPKGSRNIDVVLHGPEDADR
jgi:hypothetical protein